MSIDWSVVTVAHIQEACEQLDQGLAAPARPARSTFLLLNDRSYPAKFIRGLAYLIATGIELDPNTDYSGGDETARFFANLGLNTSKDGAVKGTSPALPTLTLAVETLQTLIEPKYEPQKQALYDLLKRRFKNVETETKFSWLIVPPREALSEPLLSIHTALEAMRSFSRFAIPGQSLRCDFFIPEERLIVEYDERQHFTLQRATALELYPADLPLGFDRQEWIAACKTIHASDPNPPYRDEQRAFYDSLRDVLAAKNGHRLVRFRQGNIDWTGSDAESRWMAASSVESPTIEAPSQTFLESADEIKKVALISHDYNVLDSRGHFDYSEHFGRINKVCDHQGCDTILYALWTIDSTAPLKRTQDTIFRSLSHLQRVIVEIYDPPDSFDHVETWVRGSEHPIVARQRFAQSSASDTEKQQFLNDLTVRQVSSAMLMICGESNITSLVRASGQFNDPYRFIGQLQAANTRIILNPIHDYMTRYEMRKKRQFYSREGRTVISVWNQGRGKEAWLPWTVFHDGSEMTNRVRELERPFPERPDIRIGIIDVAELQQI
jgi:hypothetical protein